jgi:hypothetical protein
MYVLNQKGTVLVCLSQLSIEPIKEGGECCAILHIGPNRNLGWSKLIMAEYSTMDRAKRELKHICSAISQDGKLYKMTEEA